MVHPFVTTPDRGNYLNHQLQHERLRYHAARLARREATRHWCRARACEAAHCTAQAARLTTRTGAATTSRRTGQHTPVAQAATGAAATSVTVTSLTTSTFTSTGGWQVTHLRAVRLKIWPGAASAVAATKEHTTASATTNLVFIRDS